MKSFTDRMIEAGILAVELKDFFENFSLNDEEMSFLKYDPEFLINMAGYHRVKMDNAACEGDWKLHNDRREFYLTNADKVKKLHEILESK